MSLFLISVSFTICVRTMRECKVKKGAWIKSLIKIDICLVLRISSKIELFFRILSPNTHYISACRDRSFNLDNDILILRCFSSNKFKRILRDIFFWFLLYSCYNHSDFRRLIIFDQSSIFLVKLSDDEINIVHLLCKNDIDHEIRESFWKLP